MAEKKPAVDIWAIENGVSGEVLGEKERTRFLPTSKPQKLTATMIESSACFLPKAYGAVEVPTHRRHSHQGR